MRYIGRRDTGFTLVELLAVIAIIAVLAAIVFPIVSRARHSSRKATCLLNLHQLHVAMMIYKDESGGFLPSWCITNPNPNNPGLSGEELYTPQDDVITWDLSIIDYIGAEMSLLICPDNSVAGNAEGGDPNATRRTARSYAMPRYTQWNDGAGNYFGVYVARIPNPAETVLLFEKGANLPGSWGDGLGENVYQSHDSRDRPERYRDDMFHFGGKNFLFVDGNAKWSKGGTWDEESETYVGGQGPFAWDSERTEPADDKNLGPGACELPGLPEYGGDWPPQ